MDGGLRGVLAIALIAACSGRGDDGSDDGNRDAGSDPVADAALDAPPALGPSGIDSDTLLLDLSEREARTLCEWTAEQLGGAGTRYPCGTVDGVERCLERLEDVQFEGTCTAVVRDVEDCVLAMHTDFCDALGSPVCAANVACFS